MASENNIRKHFRTVKDEPDYIQSAHNKCAPYITALVDAVRALPESKEKRAVMSAAIEFSRATEAHIANLELEMTNIEYDMSKMYMRNKILEEETKRCHAKIDITDSISLSMAGILKNKLEHVN